MIVPVDDVLAIGEHPPPRWQHAAFDDGPYAEDYGRCVPGPPPPDPLEVQLPGGETVNYQLLYNSELSSGEWMAHYSTTGELWPEEEPHPDMDAVEAWFEQHPAKHFVMYGREGNVIAVTLAWESRKLAQPLRDAFGELVRVKVTEEGARIELQ